MLFALITVASGGTGAELPIEFLINNTGDGIVGLAYQDYNALQLTEMVQLNIIFLPQLAWGVTCTH
ncbi:hypothetical protein T3A99_06095 [Pseudomonas sp. N-137]|uniref:hypothetical protein n=1 Tax=Pseudomonas sp. N-137 TaxID=3108452 RepID=UPI002ADEF976|nr:hypothetical protein [Pseudomonas sp. N-137]MEA1028138.1 hypothetical protein [Pseudomonas sp. N-137]